MRDAMAVSALVFELRVLVRKLTELAEIAASAIEARSDATGTGAAEGESAGPQDDANA